MVANIPLYGVIALSGKSWTVIFQKQTSGAGYGTTTGRLNGYGAFPYNRFPGIPVIDYTGSDAVSLSLRIPDTRRPAEEDDLYTGTLAGFLAEIQQLGIPVHRYD